MAENQTQGLSLIAAYGFASERDLADEAAQIRNMAIDGFKNRKSAVRRGYMVRLLEDNGLLEEFKEKYWNFGNTKAGEAKYRGYLRLREQHERLEDGEDPPDDGDVDDGEDADQAFALEADLRDFLANNLATIEPGLELYEHEGKTGVEYPITKGFIDILAKDGDGGFVVIELKLSRGRNKTVGQLLYYMGWVDQNLATDKRCRGVIIAREITDDLVIATRRVPGVSLYRYRVSLAVEPVLESTGDV